MKSHGRAFAVVCSLLIVVVTACSPLVKSKTPTVIVYGDSLTVESEQAALTLYKTTKQNVIFRAQGGSAMCDWTTQAAADSKTLNPTKIVLAFTGNTASCAAAAYLTGGDAGATALYEHSLRQMRAIFPTVPITLVIPPAMQNLPTGWFPFNGNADLVAMYERVGAELHMTIDGDADNSLTPGHVYAQYRPAYLLGDLVAVRGADGIHLTPAGALWYGAALLDPHPEHPSPPTPAAPSPTPSATALSLTR